MTLFCFCLKVCAYANYKMNIIVGRTTYGPLHQDIKTCYLMFISASIPYIKAGHEFITVFLEVSFLSFSYKTFRYVLYNDIRMKCCVSYVL